MRSSHAGGLPSSAQALMMLKCNRHCSWVFTREQGPQLPFTWTLTLDAQVWLSIYQPMSDVPGSLSVLKAFLPLGSQPPSQFHFPKYLEICLLGKVFPQQNGAR